MKKLILPVAFLLLHLSGLSLLAEDYKKVYDLAISLAEKGDSEAQYKVSSMYV